MPFVKWDRPRGSVHSVAHALALAGTGCNLLVLSDASLYVIQNYMALDLEFKARWADEILERGYTPISEESPNYSAWVDLIEQIQSEVKDMSCDIVAELQNIRASIDALATEQSTWDDLLTDLLLPLAEIATGADILALTASVRDQQLQCCDALAGAPYFPGGPDDTQNPETSTFCQRADSLALNWEDSAGELFRLAKTITSVGLGLVSIVVAALSLPIAILMAIVAIILGGIAELTEDTYLAYFADIRLLIRCAVFTAPAPADAKTAADAEIDAYDSQLTPIEKTLLKHLIGYEAINAVFGETYAIRADAVSDCSDCGEQLQGGCVLFDEGLGDSQNLGCGSSSFDGAVGHDNPGSLRVQMNSGCEQAGRLLYQFNGIVVSTGDTLTVWHYIDQSSNNLNAAYDIYFTDLSSLSGFDVRAQGGWYEGTLPVTAPHNGKTIDYIVVWIQKSLNGETRIAHIDDVCFTEV